MKHIFKILIAVVVFGSLFSCEPYEDRNSLPAINRTVDNLNFSVDVNDNTVTLNNLDKEVLPYWSYTDASGNELGHFNDNVKDIIIPFKGTYYVSYTAYTRGGPVQAEPVKVIIEKTDLSSITTDPRWAMLTNGAAGKTWKMYMTAPISFSGGPTDYPGWWPNLSDIGWAGLENKDWGEITFDLNEGFNVSVTQTDGASGSTEQITKTGTFNFILTEGSTDDRIVLNGGPLMLHPYPENWFSSNLANVKIIALTETTFAYGATRAGDNQWCWFHLEAKESN